jgi:thiol-disulfide isomerase/thioredoxin
MARSSLVRTLALAVVLAGGSSCTAEAPPVGSASGSRAAAEEAPGRPRSHPDFVPAGPGEADAAVREALAAAAGAERRLVVYVGATWCEPCQAFHHAVERGELDEALAGVRFVEFDSDHDGVRLQAAGYGGRMIPRFVLPDAQGRGSEQRTEGGIKGHGAVEHIMKRLGPLLAPASSSAP